LFKSAVLSAFSYGYVREQCAGCMPNKSGPDAIEIQKCTFMSFVLETNVHFIHELYDKEGWNSAVGIATRYWLDGPGIEYRQRVFSLSSRPALGPTQPGI
jgi:hypothetical protein